MTKSKTVVRKYKSKKTGEIRVKTYTYSPAHKSRGGTLVYKSGKLNQSVIDTLRATYSGDDVVEFEAELDSFLRKKAFKKGRLTVASMKVRLMHNTVAKIIANFGMNPEEVAVELGAMYNTPVTAEYILDANHWEQKANGLPTSTIILPNGVRHEFKFDYHAGILI